MCQCNDGFIGNAWSGGLCSPKYECSLTRPCSLGQECFEGNCIDRCNSSNCGVGAKCDATSNHCVCQPFYVGDPDVLCVPRKCTHTLQESSEPFNTVIHFSFQTSSLSLTAALAVFCDSFHLLPLLLLLLFSVCLCGHFATSNLSLPLPLFHPCERQRMQVHPLVLPDAVLKLTASTLSRATSVSVIKGTLVTHTKRVHLYPSAMEFNVDTMQFALKHHHQLNVSVQRAIMAILTSAVKVTFHIH